MSDTLGRVALTSVGFVASLPLGTFFTAASNCFSKPEFLRTLIVPLPRRSVIEVASKKWIPSRLPVASLISNIEELPLELVPHDGSAMPAHWRQPGVYGVYAEDGSLQYVAAVNNVANAVETHVLIIRDSSRVHAVRMMGVSRAEDAPLREIADNWVYSLEKNGLPIPPGNTGGASEWTVQLPTSDVSFSNDIIAADSDIRVEEEIRQILDKHRVVVFVKGTRAMPRCGFSRAVISILERQVGDDFVCVDCLDTNKNPGLRDGIKRFSNWPTIPQLYIGGEFIGGCDIVQEMQVNGELAVVLNS